MSWNISSYVLEGEIDNRVPGRITGWLRCAGLAEKIILDVEGDCEPDIRGKRIGLRNAFFGKETAAAEYMAGLDRHQTGKAGHITAGWPPQTWTDYPYIEWYSDTNDRVVIFLEPHQVRVLDDTAKCSALGLGLV